MLILRTQGGLGNQMFQYAAALQVAKMFNQEICFDFYLQNNDQRQFQLDKFGFDILTIPDRITESKFYIIQQLIIQLYEHKFLRSKFDNCLVRRLLARLGIIYCNVMNPDIPYYIRKAHNIIMIGYFQHPKYFADINVREVFGANCNNKIYNIDTCVCMHIRRGDYVGNKVHAVCTDEYYYKAIVRLSKMLPKLRVVVFTDDRDYVKKKMHFICDYEIFDETDPYTTLMCMKDFRYFILSNSSFSWWAQELSPYEDKVVIAPSRWYNMEINCDLYKKEWILIEV